MRRMGLSYTVATVLIGVAITALGLAVADGDAAAGVAFGAAAGVVVQVGIFWALFIQALPDRPGIAHAIGVGVRMAAVAGMAFLGVAAAGVPPAPTLFSMVGCLFASTLLEAQYIRRSNRGPVSSRTAAPAES